MSVQDDAARKRDIMARAIFVPLKFDPNAPRHAVSPAVKQQQLARNIEQHQQQVKRNIAHLALTSAVPPSQVQGRTTYTNADSDRLIASLKVRAPVRSTQQASRKPVSSADIKDPAIYPLALNHELQASYAVHSQQVKHAMLETANAAGQSTFPGDPSRATSLLQQQSQANQAHGSHLGRSILTPKPQLPRSQSVPAVHNGPTVPPQPVQRPSSSAAQLTRDVNTDQDAGGRRQVVGSSGRARRQSMGDMQGIERVEGFFRPGQPLMEEPVATEMVKTVGGNEVHPDRDPRRRRTGPS
ncbi:Hypothetical protein D9617_5g068830 [Elsinoe fawcettii]|nr:Hypothetical protein D9617_5g068830 [Elsinoe fawcettii]